MSALANTVRAETFPLHARPDLLDYFDPRTGVLFEHDRGGFVGVGAAIRVDVSAGPDLVARAATATRAALRSVRSDEEPAVAIGALPFDASADATLVVPQLTIARDGERGWMTSIGADLPLPEITPHEVPPEPWDTLRVQAETDPDGYVRAVERAVARIRAGELQKVVLARTVIAESDHAFDVPTLLARLRAVEPDAYVFGIGGLVGASPETLIERRGTRIRSRPLAGTIARAQDERDDDERRRTLLASEKDRAEHAIVVDAVREALAPMCSSLRIDSEPHTIATSKLWHLATNIEGELVSDDIDALTVAAALHPTPAVCGVPFERALATIRELEPVERGRYAGLVGWMDSRGDGGWAVTLRCAEIDGKRARLFAGAGVVSDSEPLAELSETDAKFRGLLDALRYG